MLKVEYEFSDELVAKTRAIIKEIVERELVRLGYPAPPSGHYCTCGIKDKAKRLVKESD